MGTLPEFEEAEDAILAHLSVTHQRYIIAVRPAILLNPLAVLRGQSKEGSGAADENPGRKGLLNSDENTFGIVSMV